MSCCFVYKKELKMDVNKVLDAFCDMANISESEKPKYLPMANIAINQVEARCKKDVNEKDIWNHLWRHSAEDHQSCADHPGGADRAFFGDHSLRQQYAHRHRRGNQGRATAGHFPDLPASAL